MIDQLRHIRERESQSEFERFGPTFIKHFTDRGWGQCIFAQIPLPGAQQYPLNIINTIQPQFFIDYEKHEFRKYDNHHIALLKLGRPMSRVECSKHCADRDRSAAFDRFVSANGFARGIVVPLFDFPVKRLSFAACGDGASPDLMEILSAELLAREFISPFFPLHRHIKFKAEALTNQERRVLESAARGNSSERIAEILSISVNTVNVHITNCQRKMQSSNRVETVTKALFYREIQMDLL